MHQKKITSAGEKIEAGRKVLIMLHGRGASAEDILTLAAHLQVKDYALIAPQATNHTWYPYSFMMPPQQNEPWLSSALKLVDDIVHDLNHSGIRNEDIYFSGFSQGACLTLEYIARHAKKWGGAAAFTGGLIGDEIYQDHYAGNFENTPVFIGTSDPDPHVPLARVQETTSVLKTLGASVTTKVYPHMGHTINHDEIETANRLIFGA
ncbi:MAG TPA: dienelactone hydrolase family protein [Ohtaekwangia sp.]|nr:dienelactone hydrolase family protein [Ohtaekwangia sp.]